MHYNSNAIISEIVKFFRKNNKVYFIKNPSIKKTNFVKNCSNKFLTFIMIYKKYEKKKRFFFSSTITRGGLHGIVTKV